MPAVHHPETAPIRLVHFTPQHRPAWRWIFMRPILTLTGPQRTITGETVPCAGVTASSGVKGLPSFQTRGEALAYAAENGIELSSVDDE